MHLEADTLDDLVRLVLGEIKKRGHRIRPTRGDATELNGVLLELTNPRARLSTTEDRGKLFSCLGELCWYLAKRRDLEFMEYYIPTYANHVEVDGESVLGAYGPRLFSDEGPGQMLTALRVLRDRPHSRKAVIVILEARDLSSDGGDAPCTCTLQMFLRESRLDMIATMRSNDAYRGLIHDAFSFTMLQEIAARSLNAEVGTYKHFVGSLHLYDKDRDGANHFLEEGWQPSSTMMPAMPEQDPWPSIEQLLDAENGLRETGSLNVERYLSLDPYWLDLIQLLRVLRYKKERSIEGMLNVRREIDFDGYLPFVDGLLDSMDVTALRQCSADPTATEHD